MTDHPPLPTPAEWAALCAAADQRPRGERLNVVALLARIRELEAMVHDIQTLHRGTVHPGNCYDHNLAVRAALAPSPGAGGAEEN